MSDQDNKGPLHDLSPAGEPPKGFHKTEVTISREDRMDAVQKIGGISSFIAQTKGPDTAIKNLMLGIEGSLVALLQFTTGQQAINIIDRLRSEFAAFAATTDAVFEAKEAAGATKH